MVSEADDPVQEGRARLGGGRTTGRPDLDRSPALWWSVARWVAGALVLYGLSFWALGWVFSGHPGWPGVHTKPEMYDLARSSAAMAGILGGAAAVAVALRRQKSTEETVRIGQQAYQLETDRAAHDRISALRARYTEAARQLGDSSAAVRLAGAYAMAALADDWIQRWHSWATTRPDLSPDHEPEASYHQEAQACIDVLCAYIRTPRRYEGDRAPNTDLTDDVGYDTEQRADREVRQTIIRITRDHLRKNAQVRWGGFDLDYTGAVFDGTYSFTGATFSGGEVSFDEATFSGGRLSFSGAIFSAGRLSFHGATFSDGWVGFVGATFSGGDVRFIDATFSGGRASFRGATLSAGRLSFHGTTFSGGIVDFTEATFSGGRVLFGRVMLTFSGGSAISSGATFSGGKVSFRGARFSGGEVSFRSATFSGGTVTFREEDLVNGTQLTARWESKESFPAGPWGEKTPPWAPGEQWSWPLQPESLDKSS